MIKYSTNPGKDANAINNSPTSPIQTKGVGAEAADAFDIDANDANDN